MQHKTTFLSAILVAFTFIVSIASAQTTRQLFSRPGLAISAYHTNIYDGSWSTSMRYAKDSIVCGDTLLVFEALSNTLNKTYFKIQGGKVFVQNPAMLCTPGTLYYNFDLQVGQNFQFPTGGPLLQVVEVGQKTLLNGQNRRYLRFAGAGWNIEWLEGIGDLASGLLPIFYDFEGFDRFVCARDASGELWQNANERLACDSLLCPTPLPSFSAVANDKTATFSNTSLNGTAWFWDFGDGQTSTEKNPVHTYGGPGCYEVCLTVYTNCLQRPFRQCLPTPVCIAPSWKLKPALPIAANTQSITDIEFISPDTGWVLATRAIWKTTNAGQNWTQQNFPQSPAPTSRILQKIQMLNAQTGIIACGHYSGTGSEKAILITHNGGQTWEERADNSYFLTDAILTSDGQGFATGQFKELFYSNDGGDTWSVRDIPGPVELLWLQYMGNDTLYAFGYKGLPPQHTPAFIKSYDAGLTWQLKLMPNYPLQNDAHFFNTREGWALGDVGRLIHTIDGGQTWQPYIFGEMVKAQSIAFADAYVGWAVGDKGLVLHTTHGGFDWDRENCGYLGNMRNLSVPSPNSAYASGTALDLLAFHPGSLPNCGLSAGDTEAAVSAAALELWPNPAKDYLEIKTTGISALQTGDNILIFNTLGQLALSENATGENTTLDVSRLPEGCYALVVVRDGLVLVSGRFVKC